MIFKLIQRNIRIFFRDRAAVFFSLLGPIIMFVLYGIFLGNMQADNLHSSYATVSMSNIHYFVNSWVFAGILTILTVTTSLAAIQIFVEDKENDRFKDFAVSPIGSSKIVISYLGSTFFISAVMTTVAFVFGIIYLKFMGGEWLSFGNIIESYAVLMLFCAMFSALASFVVTFIKSTSAFSSLNIIIGTSAGFLAAVYVPIGALPNSVGQVINFLPFAQAAALLRGPFVGQSIANLTSSNAAATTKINDFYGVTIKLGSLSLTSAMLVAIITSLFFIFTLAAIQRLNARLK